MASPERVQRIGQIDTYGGADHAEVERRLRSMSYGSTNSRITKLREQAAARQPTPPLATTYFLLRRVSSTYAARRLDPAV